MKLLPPGCQGRALVRRPGPHPPLPAHRLHPPGQQQEKPDLLRGPVLLLLIPRIKTLATYLFVRRGSRTVSVHQGATQDNRTTHPVSTPKGRGKPDKGRTKMGRARTEAYYPESFSGYYCYILYVLQIHKTKTVFARGY